MNVDMPSVHIYVDMHMLISVNLLIYLGIHAVSLYDFD